MSADQFRSKDRKEDPEARAAALDSAREVEYLLTKGDQKLLEKSRSRGKRMVCKQMQITQTSVGAVFQSSISSIDVHRIF